jgi:hypothetical protein
MNYQDAAIGGVSLFLLILGIVEAAKQFGVTGKGSLLLSILLGGGLFALYQASVLGLIPADVLPWIEVAVYGLGGGLAVSGLYDFVNKRLPKRTHYRG